MVEIEQATRATGEEVDFVVETFGKTAGFADDEVVGDFRPEVVQRVEEGIEAFQAAASDPLLSGAQLVFGPAARRHSVKNCEPAIHRREIRRYPPPQARRDLDNAIDGDKAQDNQFSQGSSLLFLLFDAGDLTGSFVDISPSVQAHDSRKPRGLSSTQRWNQGGLWGFIPRVLELNARLALIVNQRRGTWLGLEEIQFPCPRDGLCATVNAELAADVVDVALDCA